MLCSQPHSDNTVSRLGPQIGHCDTLREMSRRRTLITWIAGILGAVLLIPVMWILYLWLSFVPSKIVDFHPSYFQATADTYFFYSIGEDLKYSDELAREAPTLMRGQIQNALVSPDDAKIAVVVNGVLTVVSHEDQLIRKVVPVDSIYREPKPTGQSFFRDEDFQWSKDSKYLYLIKDEYYESKGSQLFSSKGELWRYSLEAANLQLVLKPFPAYSYFFGLQSGIYFSVPTDRGDLQLRYFDGHRSTNDIEATNTEFPVDKLASTFVESPFFSFSVSDYESAVLPAKRVELVHDEKRNSEQLNIGSRSYLTLTRGTGLKGPYYCSDLFRSVFLPGDRYFLLNVPYCGNYDGQLLIDILTGAYQPLPKDSRVYLRFNTDTYKQYRVSSGGISAR